MINSDTDSPIITRQLVPEDQRLAVTADLFGIQFPLRIEPTVYGITDRIAREYHGGYWLFFTLEADHWPSHGFYMAPSDDRNYSVQCFNGWQGGLSADALGITACLTAYSHLSFSGDIPFARTCAEAYHRLREYMFGHPEVAAILRATD